MKNKFNIFNYVHIKNIFLIDFLGAVFSYVLSGILLPLFSNEIGLQESLLFKLSLFPLFYGLFSIFCHLSPMKKPWMLKTIICANTFYAILSMILILILSTINTLGRVVLMSEIFAVALVVYIEIRVYLNEFKE